MPSSACLTMVEVQVGLQVPTLSSMRHVQPSWGALVSFPGGFVLHRLGIPAWCRGIPARLGRHDRVTAAAGFTLLWFLLYVCVCV